MNIYPTKLLPHQNTDDKARFVHLFFAWQCLHNIQQPCFSSFHLIIISRVSSDWHDLHHQLLLLICHLFLVCFSTDWGCRHWICGNWANIGTAVQSNASPSLASAAAVLSSQSCRTAGVRPIVVKLVLFFVFVLFCFSLCPFNFALDWQQLSFGSFINCDNYQCTDKVLGLLMLNSVYGECTTEDHLYHIQFKRFIEKNHHSNLQIGWINSNGT